MDKDHSILALIAQLRADLGDDQFDIVDHWDGDLCAIGVAKPSDHALLAYISTSVRPQGNYFLELETAPGESSEVYDVAGRYDSIVYSDLLERIDRHLD